MKRKLLLMLIIITISVVTISCSKKTSGIGDKTMTSVVIDEDTEKTTNSKNEIKVTLVAKTEKIDTAETRQDGVKQKRKNNGIMTTINGKIVEYRFSEIDNEDKMVEFPKLSLDELRIGTITDEKNEEGFNKISWENKNIKGRLITPYEEEAEARILKNNKVYKIDINGELKEIGAYDNLVKEDGDNISGIMRFGGFDLYGVWDELSKLEKVFVIDPEKNKSVTINGEVVYSMGGNGMTPLSIEGNKLYVGLYGDSGKEATPVGYIENNIYTEIVSTTDGIKMEISGDMIYSNGRILFSGFAENKYGVWNYDIENKKLIRVLDVGENTVFTLNLNKQKNKVIIDGYDDKSEIGKYSMSIGEIDENLEISKLTNFISVDSHGIYKDFRGWSDDGREVYFYSAERKVDGGEAKLGDGYYEVYRIDN